MRNLCFAVAAFGAAAGSVSAAPLRYEPFDYADVGTTVEGKTNPDGETWVGAYSNSTPPSLITVASGSLATPPGLLSAVGNSAQIDGGPSTVNTNPQQAGKALRLPLGGGVSENAGGTVYYSLALRIDELTGATVVNGGFFVGLNNSAGATFTEPTASAARLQARIDPNDAGKYNLGIFRNVNATAGATSWGGPMNVGDTLFVVASYESVEGGDQNDIARLWVNPDPGTFSDPSFSPLTTPPTLIDNTTGSGNDIGIASILLRQSLAPHVTVDELRVGLTWADVTPVPEPAAVSLFALCGAGLLSRRGCRYSHPA